MSDGDNVIYLSTRSAWERGKRMSYGLKDLDGPALQAIFESAYIDARIDSDGDCVVRDDITLVVEAEADKDVFKMYAFFPGASGTLEQALQFCNRFNYHLLVCRAYVREKPDSVGSWTVVFDYDRLTFDDERLEARSIVRLVRRFQQTVRSGITRFDQDGLF